MAGTTPVRGTPAWLRETNDRTALALLLEHGVLTRTRIGELSGLSKPTAAQMVSRLETAGLIHVVGEVSAGRGPNAAGYAVRTDRMLGVAVDIDAAHLRSTVVDASGAEHPIAVTPLASRGPEDDLRLAIDAACAAAGVDSERVQAVSVGVQGALDPRTDELTYIETLPGWTKRGIRARLEDALGVAVHIDNDVNLAAIAERTDGAGRDTGSWGSGSWTDDQWGTGEGLEDTGDQVPGRSWIRLAMIVGVCVLVLVAAVAAYQLGLKPPATDNDDEPTSTASPTVTEPTPFTGLTATDFDPQGAEPREENPDSVPNVLDGDATTTWSTSTYKQNFGPGGLKTGVGVIVDLGATKGVRRIVVTTQGGRTALAAYVTSTAPTGVADLTPVGTAAGEGALTIDLDEAVSGRYVTVWLTLLPSVSDGFRGTIAEVQVLG